MLSQAQVAELLHLTTDTVSAIPEHLLPKYHLRPGSRRVVYFWLDVVRYVLGLDPVDLGAYLDEQMRRALAPLEPARIHSLDQNGKTRHRVV